MSSLNNLNYYRRSMNSIQSFDDGMGATMENGAIVCNSFSTDNFTATTLNSTIGNITTLNTATINNTGTTTTGTLESNNIETKLTTDSLQVTGKEFNFNGTETHTRTYLSKYLTNHILVATNNNIAYIDFFSYEFGSRRDGQIKCTGGSDTINDRGILSMNFGGIGIFADTINLNGTTTIPTLNSTTIVNSGTTTTGTLGSTTINNTGTTTTGTLASTTINNTGTTTTGTLASTTINNTGTTTTGTLGSTTINNTGTTTSNILNATTSGTIPTLNSTTINNTGTTTTGTLASTTINNTGTTTTGTLGSTTINNTGTTTTGTLASTTINNTGTTTTGTLASTTINNSGTTSSNIITATTSGSIPALTCSSIQPINTASSFNLLTNSTGDINIGGSGNIYLNKNGNYALKTKTTPATNYAQIDFKSSNSTNNYDTQIVSAGGTSGTDGLGTLILKGDVIRLNGQVAFSDFIKTQTVGSKSLNTTYQNLKTSPIFISISATNGSPSVLTAKTDSSTPPTTQVAYTTLYNNVGQTIFFIVLPNNYYRVETSAGGTLQLWTEWS